MRLIKPATKLKLQFAWHNFRRTCPSGSIYCQVHWEWLKIVINSYFKSKMTKYKNLLVLFPLQRSSLQAYPTFLPFAWIHWYPSFKFVSSLQYLMSNQKFINANVVLRNKLTMGIVHMFMLDHNTKTFIRAVFWFANIIFLMAFSIPIFFALVTFQRCCHFQKQK